MSKEFKVTFEPSGRSVFVLPGTVFLEAAERAGFILETPCGGAGKCGKCVVRVTSGKCQPEAHEKAALGDKKFEEGYRLACNCRVAGPITIEIPDTSLFQSNVKILSGDSGEAVEVKPRIWRKTLNLTPPDRSACRSDLECLREEAGLLDPDIAVLRKLPTVLRKDGFKVTLTCIDNRIVDVEPGDTGTGCYGIAFDIGTTTIVGTLVDLRTGADIAVSSAVNPQTSYGDDVITRIKRCREDADGLRLLQESVLKAVNSIIGKLIKQASLDKNAVYEVVFAGNTTMQEILCGIDPSALGEMPFSPAVRDQIWLKADDLNLGINPCGDVHVFPNIGGFVGGDTVAGVVATRLDRLSEPALLVDVGTNGEIVLARDGRLIATSVAAGPAFEGARIVAGMRAANGAIEKVVVESGDIKINIIGNVKPSGICGSGLIDAAAELLRLGVLDSTGRILGADELPENLPADVRSRIVQDKEWFNFTLACAGETATGKPLCIYQRDIRELQLATAAIRAGINILLKHEGLSPTDLGSILLAGAFGNFIRRNNAKRIGMLPMIPSDRIRFVGNASSFGAKRVLLSTSEREYALEIMRKTEHLDLSLNPDFQNEFGEAMLFPEGEE